MPTVNYSRLVGCFRKEEEEEEEEEEEDGDPDVNVDDEVPRREKFNLAV